MKAVDLLSENWVKLSVCHAICQDCLQSSLLRLFLLKTRSLCWITGFGQKKYLAFVRKYFYSFYFSSKSFWLVAKLVGTPSRRFWHLCSLTVTTKISNSNVLIFKSLFPPTPHSRSLMEQLHRIIPKKKREKKSRKPHIQPHLQPPAKVSGFSTHAFLKK